jgi:hypothetical protein
MSKSKTIGIKQTKIRKCVLCGKGVAHSGHPLFFRISVERCGLNRDAIIRQSGLEQMLGGHAKLANVMGPDEDMAQVIDFQRNLWVCVPCSNEPQLLYAFMDGYHEEGDEAAY